MKLLTFARRYRDALGVVTADGVTARVGADLFVHLDCENGVNDRSPVQHIFTQLRAVAAALDVEPDWLHIDPSGTTFNGIGPVRSDDAREALAEMPDITTRTPFARFKLDRERMQWIARAMADRDIRFYLNSIAFDFSSRRMLACDGNRLHIANGDTLPSADVTAVIERITVQALLYHRADTVKAYTLADGRSALLATFPGGWILSRDIVCKYPDFDHIIPARSAQPVMRLTPEATAIIRQKLTLRQAQQRAVNVKPAYGTAVGLVVEDGTVSASLPQLDPAEPRILTALPIEAPAGRRGCAYYNAAYLLDALPADAEIDVYWTDTPEKDAGLFTLPAQPHLSAVVMPMRA